MSEYERVVRKLKASMEQKDQALLQAFRVLAAARKRAQFDPELDEAARVAAQTILAALGQDAYAKAVRERIP